MIAIVFTSVGTWTMQSRERLTKKGTDIDTQVLSNCLLMLLTMVTLPSSKCATKYKGDGTGGNILINERLWVNTRVICQWRYLPFSAKL